MLKTRELCTDSKLNDKIRDLVNLEDHLARWGINPIETGDSEKLQKYHQDIRKYIKAKYGGDENNIIETNL